MDRPAHAAKSPAASVLDLRNLILVAEWRAKKAAGFTTPDPLTIRQRVTADTKLRRARIDAGIWLIARCAEKRVRARMASRSERLARLQVLQGGRL